MEQYNYQQERELNWDDEISKENEFILLDDGDYDFVVESFERTRYEGGANMPACPCAVLNIRINSAKGTTTIKHRLMLHQKTEWALSAFFRSIGQKKKDAPLRMNWNLVPGSKGRCKVGKRTYNNNEYNEIKKFYPADEVANGKPQYHSQEQTYNQGYNPNTPKTW